MSKRGAGPWSASWSSRARERRSSPGGWGPASDPGPCSCVRPGLRPDRNPSHPARSVRHPSESRSMREQHPLRNEPKSLWSDHADPAGSTLSRACEQAKGQTVAKQTQIALEGLRGCSVRHVAPTAFAKRTQIALEDCADWAAGSRSVAGRAAVTVLIGRIRGVLESPLLDMSSIARSEWRKSLFCRDVVSHYRTKPTGAGAYLQSSAERSQTSRTSTGRGRLTP